ncbi:MULTISPECIES: LapA family protein [unclassified Rhizobium]|uniref:LapA family protein n=1 Tax=unclassified Rhizobium TaxID=2613769 RepID=UPI003D27ABC7
MSRIKKIASLVVFVPVAIILIVLCVANRQTVTLALNPFQPQDPVLSVDGPFFVYLFLAIILGMVIGSAATWVAQGKYRKQARIEARAAIRREKEIGLPETRRPANGSSLVAAHKA